MFSFRPLVLLLGLSLLASCQPPTSPANSAKHKVVYYANGAAGTVPESREYSQGQNVVVSARPADLNMPGLTFGGWDTAADGSGPSYVEGGTFIMGNSDVALYAQWGSSLVTYHETDATGGSVPASPRIFPKGGQVRVEGKGTLVRAGYTLVGWNVREDRLGTSYAAGAHFAMGQSDVDLYPVWIPDNWTFKAEDTVITVTGSEEELSGTIVIPAGVTAIGIADLSSFAGQAITGLDIPATVTSIEAFALSSTNLTHVSLPASVVQVGAGAFAHCPLLAAITVDPANPAYQSIDGAVYDKAGQRLVQVPGATQGAFTIPGTVNTVGDEAFGGCSGLTSVNIPSSVRTIGDGAFDSCVGLTAATIPATVTTVGTATFIGCSGLTHVAIEAPLTAIGDSMFQDAGITQVTLPATVTSIGANAFYRSKLTAIDLPSSVTAVGFSAFASTKLTAVTLPPQLTTISGYLFNDCRQLTSVTLPSSVKTIEAAAFEACSALTSISFPPSLTAIGDRAFQVCTSLTSITLPQASLGYSAFAGCTGLTNLEVPAVPVGSGAFSNCSGLLSVVLASGTTQISNSEFSDCGQLQSVTIPQGVISIGASAFAGCGVLTALTLPDGLASIGAGAFYSCVALAQVNIPAAVASIGGGAFQSCFALTAVVLPPHLTEIADHTFDSCFALASIALPQDLKTIGKWAFYGCFALQSVALPPGLESIAEMAFYNDFRVKDLFIPASVSFIDHDAFSQCSGLVTVTMQSPVPIRLGTGGFTFPKPWENTVYRIYVPASGLAAYKADTVFWNVYRQIILSS